MTISLIFIGFGGFSQINPTNTCPGAVLPVNTSCVANTYTMAGSFTNSGFDSGCEANSDRDDGWYQFVATATSMTVEETSTNRRHMVAVHAACGVAPALACQQSTANNTNVLNLTGLTIGATYYIHLDRRSGFNGSSMSGNICVYATPSADVAWPGLDLGTLSCTSTTNRTDSTLGAASDCGVQAAGDHLYQFTTTEVTDITLDLCGSSYDTYVYLFDLSNGDCDGGAVASNDDNCGVQSSVTYACAPAGTYVVLVTGSGGAEGNYDLDITINNCGCPTPPANDDPCTAIELDASSGTCSYTTGDLTNSTGSGVANPGCANYGGQDVWYYAIVPAGGEIEVSTNTVGGGITDGGLAIYSGSCDGTLTLLDCDDDSGPGLMSQVNATGQTPGDTIFIRMWEYGSNAEGEFDICATDPSCGALTTNDFCEDPAQLTQNPAAQFASSTAASYTYDNPDNVESVFCGTIQNNSWYQFTATSTSHSFDIISIIGCTQGIQAEVYSHTLTSQCCTGFTSVSNCYSPANTTPGTVTATGLTIGQDYVLMIDGYSGSNCDFIIDGWSAIGVLPVELVDFKVKMEVDRNLLTWTTKSETDNRWFVVERSFDGENFDPITQIDGQGNSSVEVKYTFSDYDFNYPLVYYRLRQVDFNDEYDLSKAIKVERDNDDISIYPNPTDGEINISFLPSFIGSYTVTCSNVMGAKVSENVLLTGANNIYTTNSFANLPQGMYFVEIRDQQGNLITSEKLVKK